MKKVYYTLISYILISFSCLNGCVSMVIAEYYPPDLKSIKHQNPENDANKSIDIGRYRFLAIGGYASRVPGIDNQNCIVDRQIVDIISGTGDYVQPHGDPELLQIATEYAYKYNSIIKKKFPTEIPMKCKK